MTKEEMFECNKLLAYKITNTYLVNYQKEYEDIKQLALIGLWKAVQTYNQEKKRSFSSYAYKVIHNEINSYLRKNKKYFNVQHFSDLIYENITLGDILESEQNLIVEKENNIDNEIYIKYISQNIKNEKDKRIIKLYLKGYTQQKIAKELNVSQSHVSRRIKRLNNGYR